MYDAVLEAAPMAQGGRNRKKALVVIPDGNDTNSRVDVRTCAKRYEETEVLVYAVGIDGRSRADDDAPGADLPAGADAPDSFSHPRAAGVPLPAVAERPPEYAQLPGWGSADGVSMSWRSAR